MSNERSDGRRVLHVCLAATLLESALVGLLAPLIPHLQQELVLSQQAIGVLVGAYPLGMVLAILPSGALVARVGVRDALAAGIVLVAGATLAAGWLPTTLPLIASRFVQGAGASVIWIAAMAWCLETAPASRHGRTIGTILAATFVGSMLGPLLGAGILALGFAATLTAVSAVGFGLAVTVLLMPRPRPAATATAARGDVPRLSRIGLAGLGILFMTALATGARLVLVPLALGDLGVDGNGIAAIFTAAAALAAATAYVSGHGVDRLGYRGVLTLGYVLLAALVAASGALAIGALSAVLGLANQVVLTAAGVLVATESAQRGMAYARSMVYTDFAWTTGFLAGSLATPSLGRWTSDSAVWGGIALLTALMGVAALLGTRPPDARGSI